jgi:hypothetical protein
VGVIWINLVQPATDAVVRRVLDLGGFRLPRSEAQDRAADCERRDQHLRMFPDAHITVSSHLVRRSRWFRWPRFQHGGGMTVCAFIAATLRVFHGRLMV